MITPRQKYLLSAAGFNIPITPQELIQSVPIERAVKIVYIPIIISRAAFEYADVACRICAEKKLNFKEQTRIIKGEIKNYEKDTLGIIDKEIQDDLAGSVDSFFEEADQHIEKLQNAIRLEMKKQWPELTDYSLLLNLYMCVILIDFIHKFEAASSEVLRKACMNPYASFHISDLYKLRKACMDMAGKYKLLNTDMIKLGIKILAMNIDKMVKVEVTN